MKHISIVKKSLYSNRPADEQTFISINTLNERLQRLKGYGYPFSDITFSPDVKKLKKQQKTVAVC